jgi:predicted DNA-binding protein
MSTTINLSNGIHSRLMTISQQIGRTETELIEEAILNYLEDLEDKTKYLKHQYFNMKEAYDELKFNHRKMCSEYNILSGNNPIQVNKPLKSNLSKVVENV